MIIYNAVSSSKVEVPITLIAGENEEPPPESATPKGLDAAITANAEGKQ